MIIQRLALLYTDGKKPTAKLDCRRLPCSRQLTLCVWTLIGSGDIKHRIYHHILKINWKEGKITNQQSTLNTFTITRYTSPKTLSLNFNTEQIHEQLFNSCQLSNYEDDDDQSEQIIATQWSHGAPVWSDYMSVRWGRRCENLFYNHRSNFRGIKITLLKLPM